MLRQPIDDEGCDVECPMCGRRHFDGRCSCCGYIRTCAGCEQTKQPNKLYWNSGPVFLCEPCADHAFEIQNDDAKTP